MTRPRPGDDETRTFSCNISQVVNGQLVEATYLDKLIPLGPGKFTHQPFYYTSAKRTNVPNFKGLGKVGNTSETTIDFQGKFVSCQGSGCLYIPILRIRFFFSAGGWVYHHFFRRWGRPWRAIHGGSGPRTGPHTVARIHPHWNKL